MNRLSFALIVGIVSWMIFGSMNELTSAHEPLGCCDAASPNCGSSGFSKAVWWANLLLGVMSTLLVLYEIAKFTPQGKRAFGMAFGGSFELP
tara:strand:- start:1792 stop:2067 length:276 start_codon:yes stop_codon:yes gene_type:complete